MLQHITMNDSPQYGINLASTDVDGTILIDDAAFPLAVMGGVIVVGLVISPLLFRAVPGGK